MWMVAQLEAIRKLGQQLPSGVWKQLNRCPQEESKPPKTRVDWGFQSRYNPGVWLFYVCILFGG